MGSGQFTCGNRLSPGPRKNQNQIFYRQCVRSCYAAMNASVKSFQIIWL